MKMERGYPTYTVTPKAENAIVKGHPWVYDAEILNIEGETANGGLVDVISKKGRYLGTGFLSQQSKIRVRLISRNANDRFDEAFWRRKLQWAWDYRKSVMDPADLDACRRMSTRAGSRRSCKFSMPTDSTCTLSRSWNLSTVRPGKASASPKITRQASRSAGSMTDFR